MDIFVFKKRYILIDLNQIFLMNPSDLKISISVESYDEKTAKKLSKLLRCRKTQFPYYQSYRSILNFDSIN